MSGVPKYLIEKFLQAAVQSGGNAFQRRFLVWVIVDRDGLPLWRPPDGILDEPVDWKEALNTVHPGDKLHIQAFSRVDFGAEEYLEWSIAVEVPETREGVEEAIKDRSMLKVTRIHTGKAPR